MPDIMDDPRKAQNARTYPINQGLNSPGAGITDPKPAASMQNAYANNPQINNTYMTDTGTGRYGGVAPTVSNDGLNVVATPPTVNNDGLNHPTQRHVVGSYDSVAPQRMQQQQSIVDAYTQAMSGAPTYDPSLGGGNGAGGAGGGGGYNYTTIEGGTPYSGDYDLSEYLRQQAAARIEAQLAGLSSAYQQAMNGYDNELKNIQRSYYNQRNQTAAQDAIARRNFDERAAASGLNSGTAGQADLARSAAYTGELARLGAAEDAERNAVELNRANAQSQYEQAIAQARAENDYNLAGDLYKELIRVQGLEREDALNAARAAASASSGGYRYSGNPTGDKDAEQEAPAGFDWTALDTAFGLYGLDGAQDYIKANYKTLGFDNQTQALSAFNYHLRETGKYPSETAAPAPANNPSTPSWIADVANASFKNPRNEMMYYLQGDNIPLRNANAGRTDANGQPLPGNWVTAYSPALSYAEIQQAIQRNDIIPVYGNDGQVTYKWNV